MNYIAVTLSSKDLKSARDILLPVDIPHYTLAESVATSLDIKIPSLHRPVLSVEINGTRKNLPVQSTLRDLGLKTGQFLFLDFDEIVAPAYLICMNGPEFNLDEDEMIIGCSYNIDIDLRGIPLQEYVSGRHAKILRRNNDYYFEDLGSTNGSFVNGEKIAASKEYLISDGANLLLGLSEAMGVQFVFRIRKS